MRKYNDITYISTFWLRKKSIFSPFFLYFLLLAVFLTLNTRFKRKEYVIFVRH